MEHRVTRRLAMYAPAPPRDDGWYVMRGVLGDGTEVYLWDPGFPLPYGKPHRLSSTFDIMPFSPSANHGGDRR